MNAQEAATWMTKHVSLGHGGFEAWGASCRFNANGRFLVMAVDFLTLPNRDTGRGEPLTVTFDFEEWQLRHWDTRQLVREFQRMLVFFVTHEVDECIMVDGNRVFDPHAAPVRQPRPQVDNEALKSEMNRYGGSIEVQGDPPGRAGYDLPATRTTVEQEIIDLSRAEIARLMSKWMAPPSSRKWKQIDFGIDGIKPREVSVAVDEYANTLGLGALLIE